MLLLIRKLDAHEDAQVHMIPVLLKLTVDKREFDRISVGIGNAKPAYVADPVPDCQFARIITFGFGRVEDIENARDSDAALGVRHSAEIRNPVPDAGSLRLRFAFDFVGVGFDRRAVDIIAQAAQRES